MVLTITVVGNGQVNNNGSHVLSPNDLAQLMSYQTVTGLLNPDGSITLNPNMMSGQQITSMPTSMQNGTATITSTTGSSYSPRMSIDQLQTTNSISNLQPTSDNVLPANTNTTQTTNTTTTTTTATTQKKTGQKRQTAKQKQIAKQQQQQQQQQQQLDQQNQQQQQQEVQTDSRNTYTHNQQDPQINQQPQVVATIQLPNGQIGQLIAPSGGQYWSPSAINLQQLSMAVAAATGTMPQTMSVPISSSNQPSQQQISSPSMQQQQQQSMQNTGPMQQSTQQQTQQHQQQSSQSINNPNQQQQQVMTSVQMPNNQMGQVLTRPGQNQNWMGGPISLSQLSALAQQGVVQLSPVQGIATTGPNGQRVVEMVPQAAVQSLLNQNGQPMQAISISNSGQFIAQDPNDPSKWQIVPSNQISGVQQVTAASMQPVPTNISNTTGTDMSALPRTGSSFAGVTQYVSSSPQNDIVGDNAQATQPQRKLKRLACTCPNCRDGDNGRNNGDKKKQHICHFPDCNKVYGKTSHLRAHLRWHSGERPYVCNWSYCGKKFTRSDELQRHRRTHTGEKRFQCSECLKRFMRSDHLSKHLKTHLSSKKSANIQETVGIPTMAGESMSNDQIKAEQDMIDEMNLLQEAITTR